MVVRPVGWCNCWKLSLTMCVAGGRWCTLSSRLSSHLYHSRLIIIGIFISKMKWGYCYLLSNTDSHICIAQASLPQTHIILFMKQKGRGYISKPSEIPQPNHLFQHTPKKERILL
ncbi:hypothetical protein B0T21DRAFT_368085 [Apiosordaria backusii]|uniref:Uncharacterized protein n=1 Tax=Apiosordaria backusii TaxID=314023 RepID=A0AA40BJZ2_9PEZI|nr:hypothetical protein B0T21DRAFT_368085 [Apiosordaria backusii]